MFEPDSIELRDALQDRLGQLLRELATTRARSRGESVITAEDFRACLREAVETVLREYETGANP